MRLKILHFRLQSPLSLTDLSIPLANPEVDQILIMGSTEFSGLAPLPFVNQVGSIISVNITTVSPYWATNSTSTRALSDLRSSNQSLIHIWRPMLISKVENLTNR